jgi:DNA-binding XRE family transcriptional regulator
MSDCINEKRKRELCRVLAENLPTLRAKAGISQNELADRLGFSRQTISAIEGQKREMQWSTFSAIVLFFSKDQEIYRLMLVMSIMDEDVMTTLNIQ